MYCYICRGAGSLTLKEKKTGKQMVFQCYKCDGEGYCNTPYEEEPYYENKGEDDDDETDDTGYIYW